MITLGYSWWWMEYWEEEIEEEEEEEEEGCNQMSGLHHSCRLLDFDTKSAVCKCCANSHLIESAMALKWTSSLSTWGAKSIKIHIVHSY